MKRKLIKIFIAFIIVVGILTIFVLAEVNDSLSNYDTELRCDKEEILYYEEVPVIEYNSITKEYDEIDRYVSYKYISDEEVPAQTYNKLKEDMSKRTVNSVHFNDGNQVISKIYAGQQFFEKDDYWFQIKWTNIELESFNTEIGDGEGLGFFHVTLSSIIKFFDIIPLVSAAVEGRTYRPESDISVALNPSAGTDNYAMVDDVVADNGATNNYLTVDTTTYDYDFYGLPDHPASLDDYDITNVILYARGFGCNDVTCSGAGGGSMQFALDDASHAPDYGEEFDLDKVRTLRSHDYGATNPLTGSNWTWSDIDGLYIGVGLKEKVTTDFYVYLDQVYMVVKSTADYDVGAGDGWIQETLTDTNSWDTVHDAVSGSADATAITATVGSTFRIDIGPPVNLHYTIIKRGFFPIDTSSIPSANTVSAADFVFFASAGTNMRLVQTSQANETTLANADFDECGAIDNPTAGATDFLLTGPAWNTIALNATGISWIKKDGEAPNCGGTNGWTCLGLRDRIWDADDLEAEHSSQSFVGTSESGNQPYLLVTHSVGGGTCSPTSPLSANHLFECSDDCTQSTNLEANGFNITINGTGSFLMTANISNVSIGTVLNGCNVTCSGGCII